MLANHQQGVMPGGVVSSPGRGSNPNHNNSTIVGSNNRPPTNISNATASSNRTAFPTNNLNKPIKCCDWCEVPGKSTKFVLKHSGTAKEFCSQECMNEYQNSLSPLCCQFCKKRLTGVLAVRSDNRGRSFCSVECLQKLRVKEVQLQKQQQQHLQNLNLTSSVRPQQHPPQERTLPSTTTKAQTPQQQQNPLLSQQQKLQPPAHPQQQKPAVVHPQPSKSNQQQTSAVPMSSSLSQTPSTPPSSGSNNLRKIPVSSLTGGTLLPPSLFKMKGIDNSSTTSSSVSSSSEKGMASSKLTPATRPKSKDKQRDILYSHFDWDEYLMDTNSTPAPKECFKQSHVPPSNDFDIGMKLEARDPRNTSVVTLATVIHKYGSRILLRLDGTDSSNDFYELVDSENIQQFGTCELSGELLQPPLGFTQNLNKWSVFQVKQLHNAKLAPKECFKQEPLSPKSNMFEVAMKLEAVEKKYPYYVYPATIEDVNDDKIKISFDGYPESMSYWTDYRSRDLFWCGFTKESGGFLQYPGEVSSKATNKSTKAKTPSATTVTTKEGKKETPTRKTPLATPTQKVVNGTDSKNDKKSQMVEGKTELSAKKVNGNTGDNREREQIPKTDAKVVKPSVQHTSTTSMTSEGKHFTLKIKPPQPPSSDRNHRVLPYGDGCRKAAIVKQVQSGDCDTAGNKRKMEESQILSDSETATTPLKKKPPSSTSSSLSPSKPSTPAYRPSPTPETKAVSPTPSSSSTSTSSTVHLSPPRPPPTVASLNIPRDPNEWTTEQTFSYIISIDPTLDIDSLKKSFIENLIDGKSFLLLSSDMMMKYMNIKLGPALKIAKISESLNKGIGSRNQGR